MIADDIATIGYIICKISVLICLGRGVLTQSISIIYITENVEVIKF